MNSIKFHCLQVLHSLKKQDKTYAFTLVQLCRNERFFLSFLIAYKKQYKPT